MIVHKKSKFTQSLLQLLVIGTSITYASVAQAQVTTFENCNYTGKKADVPVGQYTWPNLLNDVDNLKDNDISSIKVGDGYKATLYADPNYKGRKFTVTRDIDCLKAQNFDDTMSSIKVERTSASSSSGAFNGNKIGAVTLPGAGASLEQISAGKNKSWVWTKSLGDQVLFYENSRTADAINLQDANTRAKAKINLKTKRFTAAKGHNVAISSTSNQPDSFRELHFIEIKNQIIAAYYADGNDVYGGAAHSCSHFVDDAYKSLFKPACEEHDRYYNAPWEDLLGPWDWYTQKDKILDDKWETKNELAKATKEVIELTFVDHMGAICDDLETSVQIFSGDLCNTARQSWYHSLRGWGTFFHNQHGVSAKTKHDPDYLPIMYSMPRKELEPLIMNAAKWASLGSIVGGAGVVGSVARDGTDFEVEIDCNVSGADDETTKDTITVEFFNQYKRSVGKRSSNGVGSCFTDKSFTVSLNDVPDYFTVSTSGSDGYMIDELVVRKNGDSIGRIGTDNDKGWCLSTDPRDSKGDWADHVFGKCQKSHTFSMKNLNSKLNYSVRIDCLVSGADDEETSNRISVAWYSGDGRVLGGQYKNGISTCHGANDEWAVELNEPAAYIKVSTNGSDGYLMDQIEMYIGDEEVREHGNNDDRGWCLSTDNGDHNRGNFYGHSVDSKCPPTRRFDY